MRSSKIVIFCLAMAASVAWAGQKQTSVDASAASPAAEKSLNRVKHQQSSKQDEVKRLERDVTRQQSDSEQAGRRLQQQDQAIAELRKQLQKVQAQPSAVQH